MEKKKIRDPYAIEAFEMKGGLHDKDKIKFKNKKDRKDNKKELKTMAMGYNNER